MPMLFAVVGVAIVVSFDPWPLRLLGGLAALCGAWVSGVMDGHEHLRRKNPEAYQAFR